MDDHDKAVLDEIKAIERFIASTKRTPARTRRLRTLLADLLTWIDDKPEDPQTPTANSQ